MGNRSLFLLTLLSTLLVAVNLTAGEATWKAGTAKVKITPKQAMWMAGYGNRNRPAEGTLTDLWIKALALESADGHRAIVFSTDLLGIPQSIYNNTCEELKSKFGLGRSQIMINSSHTHTGPVLRSALYDIYPVDDAQITLIESYSAELEKKLVKMAGDAFSKMEPVRISAGQGTCTVAVNRRNNLEPDVPELRKNNALKGPIDHSVPVLSVRSNDGKLMAVVFGYACHNTVLSFYRWSGDYSGFAQIELEKKHPGALALFYMGCGADQNPLPRRKVEQAQQYGQRLAAAVDRVLAKSMNKLRPSLKTEYELVSLNFGDLPTQEELKKTAGDGKPTNYRQRWASRLLKQLDSGKPFLKTYPYPLQVWKLGGKQLWITMGGEVVVDYSLGFKKEFGAETWVAGYCNDVMAYIPSLRVLEEDVPPRASSRWGYEGNTSMYVYGQAAHRWKDDIETLISTSIQRMVKKLNQ
jgi:neutral ceramidase